MKLAITVLAVSSAAASAQPSISSNWPCLSGDGARASVRSGGIVSMAAPRWIVSHTAQGQEISFVGPAGVVGAYITNSVSTVPVLPGGRTYLPGPSPTLAGRVRPAPRLFAAATIGGESRALSIDARTGSIVWSSPIPDFAFDSWSTPAVDVESRVVLVSSGSELTALRVEDGSIAWQASTASIAVNASPVITNDLGSRNRAFITDYGGFGGPSFLYCINVSAHHQTLNPFHPGDIVWAAPIGSASGATPAYLDGVVYVASTGLDTLGYGEIRAFDATATATPAPFWTFSNPVQEGFFGGVCVRDTPSGRFVYAATYAFYGGLDSANLVKVDALSGALEWSVPSNRTDSVPVVLPDGRIAISTGIHGFGSVPSVQMFRDDGVSATMLWDTAQETWDDANGNGVMELGEFLLVGGRTTHPALAIGPGGVPKLLVGAIPTQDDHFGPYTVLLELDLSKPPDHAGFVVQQGMSGGSTPAIFAGGVYTVGTSGLAAFGPPLP